MADFNLDSATLRGMQWRPNSSRQFLTDSSRGLLQRFKSGGAVTESAVDVYLASVVGAPRLAVEILDSVSPTRTTQTIYPGTDTGATTTGWEDASAGAASYADIDDALDTSDHVRNASAFIGYLDLAYRGSVAALSGKRIISVTIKVYARVSVFASGGVAVDGLFNLGGTTYLTSQAQYVHTDGQWTTLTFTTYTNPSTGLPWTQAEVNTLVQNGGAATDEFGLRVYSPYVYMIDDGFNVASMWLDVVHVTENRKGYYYGTGTPTAGWQEATLSATAALSSNTYYYLHVYNLAPNGQNYFSVPILRDPNAIINAVTGASTTTAEHRKLWQTWLQQTTYVLGSTVQANGEMIPFLLDRSGTIETQSQPYCELDTVDVYSGSPANFGTEITSAAGATTYGAIKVPVGWQNTGQRPDAPLVIEIRRGGGMLTGGGTLDATATLYPSDTPNGSLTDRQITVSFTTQAGATQYALFIYSTATNGRGWKLGVLDTRSDLVVTAPSAAEVQGASQGGTTDSYFTGGTEDDRYDIAACLVQAPTTPGSFTATATATV